MKKKKLSKHYYHYENIYVSVTNKKLNIDFYQKINEVRKSKRNTNRPQNHLKSCYHVE